MPSFFRSDESTCRWYLMLLHKMLFMLVLVLLCVVLCRLGVQCSSNLPTADLEAEVFLHVLHNCVEYVQAEGDPDPRSAAAVAYADGDGMTR